MGLRELRGRTIREGLQHRIFYLYIPSSGSEMKVCRKPFRSHCYLTRYAIALKPTVEGSMCAIHMDVTTGTVHAPILPTGTGREQ